MGLKIQYLTGDIWSEPWIQILLAVIARPHAGVAKKGLINKLKLCQITTIHFDKYVVTL